MQVEVKVDENCKATRIIIVTDKMTEEINEIIKRLSDEQPKMIAGFKEDVVEVLEPTQTKIEIGIGDQLKPQTRQPRKSR